MNRIEQPMYQNHLTVAGGSHLPSRGGSRNASRGGSLNPSRSGSRNASRNASRECSPSVSRRGSHNASTRRKGANQIILFSFFSFFSSFVYICAIYSLSYKIFQEHYPIVKQFESRSRSELFAKVIKKTTKLNPSRNGSKNANRSVSWDSIPSVKDVPRPLSNYNDL